MALSFQNATPVLHCNSLPVQFVQHQTDALFYRLTCPFIGWFVVEWLTLLKNKKSVTIWAKLRISVVLHIDSWIAGWYGSDLMCHIKFNVKIFFKIFGHNLRPIVIATLFKITCVHCCGVGHVKYLWLFAIGIFHHSVNGTKSLTGYLYGQVRVIVCQYCIRYSQLLGRLSCLEQSITWMYHRG